MNQADVLQFLSSFAQPPQGAPAPQPVAPPSAPPGAGQVPVGPEGLPALPPLPVGKLSAGYLPSWPQAMSDASHNLMPQVARGAAAIAGAGANVEAQGGATAALIGAAQNRYGGGTWKEALTQAGADFDGIMGAIKNEPSRLYSTYTDSGAARQKIGSDPAGALMDASYALGPAEGAARLFGGRVADRFLIHGLQNTPMHPPMVQGMMGQQPAVNVPGMIAPDVRGIDVIPGVNARQAAQVAEQGTAASVPLPWQGNERIFDPLHEGDMAPIGEIMQAQDRTRNNVFNPHAASMMREMQNPWKFNPLVEPVAPDTIGRVMQAQDMADRVAGTGGMPSIGHSQMDPLTEPPQGTIGAIQAKQDYLAMDQNRPVELARSLPDWRQERLVSPNPQQLEEHAGIMQPLRGTPTEPTGTLEMENTRLQLRIRELQSRRAYATNKHDRAFYDKRIEEMQDAMRTPEGTMDNSGHVFFQRTRAPSQADFPFRRIRMTDEHPNDLGISPPGKTPGDWVQTGKHWRWERHPKPDTPGSRTISDLAGHDARGHSGHWTGEDLGGGDRIWAWLQDTFNTKPGTTTREDAAANRVFDQGTRLPMRMPEVFNRRIVGPDDPDAVFNNDILNMEEWGKFARNPAIADKLANQALNQRALHWNDPTPPAPPPDPTLGMQDPQFHARPDFQLRPPVAPGEMIGPPEGLLGSNPFDPQGARFQQQPPPRLSSAPPPPADMQQSLPMFGLRPNMDYMVKADRDLFRTEAKKAAWESFPGAKKIAGGVNASYKRYYNGDRSHPYWTKTRTENGDISIETAALNAGDAMGVTVLPVVQYSPDSIVTPWVDGLPLGDTPHRTLEKVFDAMDPKTRDKQLFYEFLMADADKHDWNYFVDEDNMRVIGIDYGNALRGDEHTALNWNAFVAAMRRHFDPSTEISRDAIRELMASKGAATDIFRNTPTVTKQQLDRLAKRFDLLEQFGNNQKTLTYADLRYLPHGGP